MLLGRSTLLLRKVRLQHRLLLSLLPISCVAYWRILLISFLPTAGLGAGVTEAVAVVTPMEVIKIRLQGQYHSMADPLEQVKYRSAPHALYTVVKEEGVGALWRGVSLTALRQGKSTTSTPTIFSLTISCLRLLTIFVLLWRIKSSSKLHRLHRIQTHVAELPTSIREFRPSQLSNHTHRPRLRSDGTAFKRTHRHDQNPSTEKSWYPWWNSPWEDQEHRSGNV